MSAYLESDEVLEDEWWDQPYKADPQPGQHLANRTMSLCTTLTDLLILGDREVAPLVPGRVSFANQLDDEARSSAEQIATYFFNLSHFVADSCQPCHCDARKLAADLNTTLAITGPVDLVTDGDREVRVSNGHPLLSRVTGTGCTVTALIGAFLAVEPDGVSAAAAGLAYFGVAAERAAQSAAGPGSFMIALLDALYQLTPRELKAGCRIEAVR